MLQLGAEGLWALLPTCSLTEVLWLPGHDLSQRSRVLRDRSFHHTPDQEIWQGAAGCDLGYPPGHHGEAAAAAAGGCWACLDVLTVPRLC